MNNIKKILLGGMLCAFPCTHYAQNKLDSLQYLQEVVITAKPFEEIIPVQKLSGDILQTLSVHSVADALRYFSGIQVKDYGGIGGLKTIDVRNMGSHHVGVFYDGIELNNAQNGVIDLGNYSLDDMEELSLYNGQKSDIFQSAKDFSAASTVYLKTKRPRFVGDKKTNVILRYKAMSIDFINPSFRVEQRISPSVTMSASGEMTKTNGRYKFRYKRKNLDGTLAYDTTATRTNSDVEAYRLETAFFGRIEDGGWSAKTYYYDSNRGAPGAIVANKFDDGFRQKDKNFFAQGEFTKDFSDQYHFQFKGKYAFDKMNYIARDTTHVLGDVVTESAQFDDTYYQQEIYASVINMYNITDWWDVSASADFQWNKLNATRLGISTAFAYPTRYTLLGALATSLNLGKFKAMVSVNGAFVHETVRNGAAGPNKKEFSPAVFLGYKPFQNHDFNVRAFAKRVFRMPTFNDLYYTQVGSSALNPEYVNQVNLGFTYNLPFRHSVFDKFSIQTDAYLTRTTDKIIAAPTGNLFRWMMSNVGKVKGKGVEASAALDMHFGAVQVVTNLSYAYSEQKDYTKIFGLPLSSYGDQIPYTPWHSGSAICSASYKSWNLNYSFFYVGERYNGAFNNIEKNKVQPWYTHDIALQKQFQFSKLKANASVEVNNLFDQQYEVIYNYPMPGRTFKFIIGIEL